MKKIFFKKRIAEPESMDIAEQKEFEKMSLNNYEKWTTPLIDDLLNKLKIKDFKNKNLKILDLACGPGLLSKKLSFVFPKSEIIGIDVSEYSIKLAKKNCKGIKNIKFMIGNAQNISFPNDYFDIIICKDSLHHFQNALKSIKEMYRVLKKNGIIYIQDLRRDVPFYLIKTILPPDNLSKRLIYYSTRSAYLLSEIKKILKKIGIKKFVLKKRNITKKIKDQYEKIGINIQSLKQTFSSRFVLIIKK